MRKFLRQAFSNESSISNEDEFSLTAINTIIVTTAIALVIGMLLPFNDSAGQGNRPFGTMSILTLTLVARHFLVSGRNRAFKVTLLGGLWLILSYLAYNDGGLQSLSFTVLLLSIFVSGLLANVQGIAIFAFGTALTASGLYYLEIAGQLPITTNDDDSLYEWIAQMITIIATAIFTTFTSKRVDVIFARQRENEQALRKRNHELEQQKDAQMRTSLQLERSNSLLEATFESIADGILVIDNDLRFVVVNQMFRTMWNLPEEMDHGRPALQHALKMVKYPDEFVRKINEIYGDRTCESHDLVELSDGRIFERQSRPQRMGEKIVGRVWTYKDITAVKRTEEALSTSEELFRNIFELAPIGIAMTGLDGSYIQVNQAMCETLGYSAVELQQMVPSQITHPDDIDIQEALRKKLRLGEISKYQLEKRYLRSDKSIVMASVHIALVKDENGDPLYNIGLMIDQTEKKRTEEALLQAQKLESLGVMSGGIAHDFNNMLTAILAQSSLALARLSDDNQARTSIEKAVTAAHRAADLTRQLLAYSGSGQFESKPVNMTSLVRENLHLANVAIESKAKLDVILAKSLPNVIGDSGQFQQVVMNLLINAAESVHERNGLISICTRAVEVKGDGDDILSYADGPIERGNYVLLEIRDNGIGMDQETLSKIFDPFFTTKVTGRGLGLAAVLGIVRGHGGWLRVESQPDEGTTFQIFLPASTEQGDAPNNGMAEKCELAEAVTVLIIDDQASIREAACDILHAEGIEAIAATDGLSGIQLFEERMAEINLILLDLSMPGLSGQETMLRLREIDAHIPIVLTSGYSAKESISRFDNGSVSGFLQKPYAWNQLVDTIRRHL